MFGKKLTIQISEDWVIQNLMGLPKGVLVGMFIEASNRLCKKERIDPGLYYHALFKHEIPEAERHFNTKIVNRKPEPE